MSLHVLPGFSAWFLSMCRMASLLVHCKMCGLRTMWLWIACTCAAAVHSAHQCAWQHPHVSCYVLQDLSGGNVLLTSSSANAHGFTARVVDFGLARSLDVKARTAPGRYGTITHMAPETIREGELSIACDVYAWGVQLWEMITGGHR